VVEDVVMVFPAPFGIMSGAPLLEAVSQASPWVELELEEIEVVEHGDTAVLAYRARAKHETGAAYETYAGSVYVRGDGAWKLVLHQQTPIPEG
jgi:ketosteroid isomerase-like protein